MFNWSVFSNNMFCFPQLTIVATCVIGFVNILVLPFLVGGRKMLVIKLVYKTKLSNSKIILSSEHNKYKWVSMKELSKLPTAPGTMETINLL